MYILALKIMVIVAKFNKLKIILKLYPILPK